MLFLLFWGFCFWSSVGLNSWVLILFHCQLSTAQARINSIGPKLHLTSFTAIVAHRCNYILDILGCRIITAVIIHLCSLRNSSKSLEFSTEEIISDYNFFILYVFLCIELVLKHLYSDYFKFSATFELLIRSLIHLSVILFFLFIENRFLSLTMHPDHSFPSLCSSQLSLISFSLIPTPPPFPL